MDEGTPTTKQQFLDSLNQQRESIANHERISQEMGIELSDKQAGHIAGMLRMCTMVIEQVEELMGKV